MTQTEADAATLRAAVARYPLSAVVFADALTDETRLPLARLQHAAVLLTRGSDARRLRAVIPGAAWTRAAQDASKPLRAAVGSGDGFGDRRTSGYASVLRSLLLTRGAHDAALLSGRRTSGKTVSTKLLAQSAGLTRTQVTTALATLRSNDTLGARQNIASIGTGEYFWDQDVELTVPRGGSALDLFAGPDDGAPGAPDELLQLGLRVIAETGGGYVLWSDAESARYRLTRCDLPDRSSVPGRSPADRAREHHMDACLDNHSEEDCVAVELANELTECTERLR